MGFLQAQDLLQQHRLNKRHPAYLLLPAPTHAAMMRHASRKSNTISHHVWTAARHIMLT
jgi:hypothetical protein